MSMTVFYYLSDDDKEKCFVYYAKGTIFQDQPAYVTAYDVCKGLTAHFNEVEADVCRFIIPLRDASSGRHFTVAATQGVSGAIDKMISWLRAKHYIFYTPGLNLDAVLDHDRLSYRVNAFWNAEDKRQEKIKIEEQQKIENYCKNDLAYSLSLGNLRNQYVVHHTPPIKYSFPLDKPVGRVTNAHIGQPGEGIRIDIELFDKQRAEAFIEELWRLISDEPVPEIKNVNDQIDFYNKVRRTVAKHKNELLNLRKDNDTLNAKLLELRSDHDALTESYTRLWQDKERKKRMLNSYYGATCGATADAYGEIQRLKKERDELKERLENLEGGGYACSGCHRTTCGYFAEILSSLGIKDAYITSGRRGSMSIVEAYAKAANERAQTIFKENQTLMQQVDAFSKIAAEDKDKIESLKRVISGLNVRVNNQSSIIKTQNESLTKQSKQLKDLGASLRDIKEVVDCEMDDLMQMHGDDIIPMF